MKVSLVEVGPRDGLQNEAVFIPTSAKIAWINQLSDTGLTCIEATSFVSPKWVPQMRDHSDVLQGITRKAGVRYPVLVPNIQGLQLAVEAGVQEIAVFVAASESFAQKNTHCSIDESFTRLVPIMALAREHRLDVRGYVSCIVSCPYEGAVKPEAVREVALRLFALGCSEVSLGDTTGKAWPDEMHALLTVLRRAMANERLAGHFHDTAGRALAHIAMAYDDFAITTFDSSTGGIGGCPYAPGAKGNVATEKVVDYFEARGIATGIDRDKLLAARTFIQTWLSSSVS